MNRSELETMSRKQLLALAERAGIAVQRGLGKAGLIELLSSAPIDTPRPETPAELPAHYGRTRLTLVEIEPHWIHAYWEITAPDCLAARAAAGPEGEEATWVLRFYNVTDVEFNGVNARDSFDVPVDVSAGNWYVNLWSGGKSYCAEMGLRAPGGSFAPVSRSGVVQVPAAAEAPRAETEWMNVEPATGETTPAKEPAREEMPAPVAAVASKTNESVPAVVGTVVLPPAEQPVVLAAVAENIVTSESARAAVPETFPLPPPPPTVAGFDVASASQNAAETNRWCEELRPPPGSNGNGNGHGHATVAAGQPASQESPAAEPEGAPSSHSVERFGTSSGGFDAAAERSPSIKLELNADLVIYGRAMPGQLVEVCGRSVKVNPDGTFSVRMALPLADGDAARGK